MPAVLVAMDPRQVHDERLTGREVTHESLGERLSALRVQAGLSQEQLAAATGVSAKTISDLERGVTRNPRPSTIRAIADALGLEGAQRVDLLGASRHREDPEAAATAPATLADAVSAVRRRLRLTAGELGNRAGLSARTIADIEAGRRKRVHPANAASLAEALGIGDDQRGQFMALARGFAASDGVTFGAAEPPSLAGRAQELATVLALLGEHRLITLTGPGGVGKTTLAEAVLAATGRPAVTLRLADVPAGATLTQAIALVTGLDEGGTESGTPSGTESGSGTAEWSDQLSALLPRDAVLLLDNLEHLTHAAGAVDAVLDNRADVSVVATSRTATGTAREYELEVGPLRLPAACRVFSDVAEQAGRPVPPRAAEVVERICVRLDRLPLAITLAATWSRLLSPHEILARLDRPAQVLHTPGGARPRDRHTAVTSTVRWSLALVGGSARTLFVAMSAHPAAWPLDLIEAVHPVPDVLDALHELVQAKLVTVTEDGPRTLYGMLQTVRDVGLPELTAPTLDRHAEHLLARARTLRERFLTAGQKDALVECDRLALHVDGALRHLVATNDGRATALAAAWWRYWKERLLYRRGLALVVAAYELTTAEPAAELDVAEAAYGAAALAYLAGENDPAAEYAHEALRRFREVGDQFGIGNLLSLIGMMTLHGGDVDGALGWYRQGLREVDPARAPRAYATLLANVAPVYAALDDLPAARTAAEDAAARYQRIGDDSALAAQLGNLGQWAARMGDRARARELLTESRDLLLDLLDPAALAEAYLDLAKLAIDVGDIAAAQVELDVAWELVRSSDYPWGQALAVAFDAELCVLRGDMRLARRHARSAMRQAEALSYQPVMVRAALADAAAAAWSGDAEGALRAAGLGLAQSEQADEAAVVSLALVVAAVRLDATGGPLGVDDDAVALERAVRRWAAVPGAEPYAVATLAARRRGLTVTPLADGGPPPPVAELRGRALALCPRDVDFPEPEETST